jgi:hypothetical protein
MRDKRVYQLEPVLSLQKFLHGIRCLNTCALKKGVRILESACQEDSALPAVAHLISPIISRFAIDLRKFCMRVLLVCRSETYLQPSMNSRIIPSCIGSHVLALHIWFTSPACPPCSLDFGGSCSPAIVIFLGAVVNSFHRGSIRWRARIKSCAVTPTAVTSYRGLGCIVWLSPLNARPHLILALSAFSTAKHVLRIRKEGNI